MLSKESWKMGHDHKIIFYSTLFHTSFTVKLDATCAKNNDPQLWVSLEFFIFCLRCVCDSAPMQEKAARIRS